MANLKIVGKSVSLLAAGIMFSGIFVANAYSGNCRQYVEELHKVKPLMKRKVLLDEAIKECADNYLITYYYAYSLERRRKYGQAAEYYQAAIDLNPDYARSYFGLGDTFLVLKRNEQAAAAFLAGLQLEPDNTRAAKSMKEARRGLSVRKVVKERDCPKVMTILASAAQAVHSGGLAENYLPEPWEAIIVQPSMKQQD